MPAKHILRSRINSGAVPVRDTAGRRLRMAHQRASQRAAGLGIILSMAGLAVLACGPALPFSSNPIPTPDSGTGLEKLDNYTATFEAKFAPDNQNVHTWTYNLDLTDTPQGSRRTLSINGVDVGKDPGDTILI